LGIHHVVEAVIQVVLNQRLLGLCDGLLNGLQLLHHVQTRFAVFQHLHNTGQVSSGAAKPFDDSRVGIVNMHRDQP